MDIVFEHTKHKKLWEYMAKEETITAIVEGAKFITSDKHFIEFRDIYPRVDDLVQQTKKKKCNELANNEYVVCSCFACDTNDSCNAECDECPIKIGCCINGILMCKDKYVYGSSLYNNYILAIYYMVVGDTDRNYMEDAQKFANDIANAELDNDVLDKYDIVVK